MQNVRALGLRPQTPLPLAARGFAPDPQPPAAESFTFRPPLAFGRWGLRPQTPELATPIANLRISGYAPASSFYKQYFRPLI